MHCELTNRWLIVLALLGHAGNSLAVEPVNSTSLGVSERWAVVGVIADSVDHGVAVLKNTVSGRTFTVEVGEALPTDYSLTLHSVQNRTVMISDGQKLHPLTFAEASSEEVELPSRTARFLDNYYRGLNEMPMEIFSDADADPAENRFDGSVGGIPLTTFGRIKGDLPRSRLELYRAERPYDAQNDSEFIVNYDNFEDGLGAEAGGQMGGGMDLSTAEDPSGNDADSMDYDASSGDIRSDDAASLGVPSGQQALMYGPVRFKVTKDLNAPLDSVEE